MTTDNEDLRGALADFMEASSSRDVGKIAEALTRIADLQARLGPEAHPMLRHYLERRSYQKALEFLDSGRPETETPQCQS